MLVEDANVAKAVDPVVAVATDSPFTKPVTVPDRLGVEDP